MPKKFPLKSSSFNPFGELVGLNFSECKGGQSRCVIEVTEKLMNPYHVVHGGVIYAMADTGMGAALYSILGEDETCITVEIKIAYFKGVRSGALICETKVLNKGKKIATLESEIKHSEHLIAKAMGTFYIRSLR